MCQCYECSLHVCLYGSVYAHAWEHCILERRRLFLISNKMLSHSHSATVCSVKPFRLRVISQRERSRRWVDGGGGCVLIDGTLGLATSVQRPLSTDCVGV